MTPSTIFVDITLLAQNTTWSLSGVYGPQLDADKQLVRFQLGFISQPMVFFSYNRPASVGLISLEINQRTGQKLPSLLDLKAIYGT